MGKLAILLVMASMIGSATLMMQSERTNIESHERQGDRQKQLLAREIARSGFNYMRAQAGFVRRTQQFNSTDAFIAHVNGGALNRWHTGTFQGGTYKTQVRRTGASASFDVISVGEYQGAVATVGRTLVAPGILTVPKPSTLKARFLESQAGYCSGVYLQRTPADWTPGEDLPEPELVFTASKNRDGEEALYETTIDTGTQLNFFLAVDMNCSNQKNMTLDEQRALPLTSNKYDYYHSALDMSSGINEMRNGKYAIIQENGLKENTWRIAFEDLIKFSDDQHEDVRRFGYGDMNWRERSASGSAFDYYFGKVEGVLANVFKYKSYGGNGWTSKDAAGYYRLGNTSKVPDFSDQVFEVELIDADPNQANTDNSGNNGHGNTSGCYNSNNPGQSTGCGQ
jgi:hypothetical protein